MIAERNTALECIHAPYGVGINTREHRLSTLKYLSMREVYMDHFSSYSKSAYLRDVAVGRPR